MQIQRKMIYIKNNILKSKVTRKLIKNSSWLVGDKVFTMIIGVFVTAMVARYFGPENFGQFNYAISFVSLFSVLSTLGLETLTVKAIVDEKYDEGEILCTSLILRVIGGILLTFLAMFVIRILEPDDHNMNILVLIMSLTMIFKSFEVIEYWIQAYQRAKISSVIRMGAYIIVVIFKVALVVSGGTLIHYALIYMLNVLIVGVALVIAYFMKNKNDIKWRLNVDYGRNILSQSWYLILSGLMGTLYMKIDKVMLGSLITRTEVGVYSAASQVAQMWYFVPAAIIVSFKPIIMERKKKAKNSSYIKSVQLLYTIVCWVGIFFGLFIFLFSDVIIGILYGADYLKAASILWISVWAGTFAMLGSTRGIWLICEGLQKYAVIYITIGAFLNIILNYILIPNLGGYGAAIATLFTQISVAMIIPAFIKETKISSIMMLRAFKFEGIRELIRKK